MNPFLAKFVSSPSLSPPAAAGSVDPTPAIAAAQWRRRAAQWLNQCAATLCGFGLLLAAWQLVSMNIAGIPGPAPTFRSAAVLFADPFYDKGPNDMGIGWNILASLGRVAAGFALAAAVGIPAGFLIGRFKPLDAICAPVISLLRPVSPLAWLPLGLLLFKAANPAAIWAIFICSIWPLIINTADGVRRVPQDYMNVARVLNLPESTVFARILLPAALPHMLTGVRLSIGTAWLVIVAAEMLTGGTGIGFWLWDEWNNLNVQHILVAIFVIGAVGLALDAALGALARHLDYKGE
ncbi:nitrate ABC transporter permease [Candidimonas humi]|uniref:Nitrate ABC transporter permease n=1 Tax=Candidimonas humi TaxID=683355 RepID=A0ABV8NYG8_9BURK|nr:nitrate ABC transporter permease [Candidimonas humi]MBV6304248.1 nitrate ABC transporter permease [Candidimonas humi]